MEQRPRTASQCMNGRVIVHIRSADRLAVVERRRGHLRRVSRQMRPLGTSDRSKFGRGGLSGRKAASSASHGKSSRQPAGGEDVFERSTDRNTSRRKASKSAKPADEKTLESAESADIAAAPQVDEHRIESATHD